MVVDGEWGYGLPPVVTIIDLVAGLCYVVVNKTKFVSVVIVYTWYGTSVSVDLFERGYRSN